MTMYYEITVMSSWTASMRTVKSVMSITELSSSFLEWTKNLKYSCTSRYWMVLYKIYRVTRNAEVIVYGVEL